MISRLSALIFIGVFLATGAWASKLFIPMDRSQTDHLRAYGVAFAAMQQGVKVDWLLNYKGGSFGMDYDKNLQQLCTERGVAFEKLSDRRYDAITAQVTDPSSNGQLVKLEKAPKIAVYTPLNKEPWDDAVTLALTYAGIPFDKVYVNEVLAGDLDKYDWLHLHHEDFTGQYGKFWAQFHTADWYQKDVATMEALAAQNGYRKVSQMQLAVAKKIKDFVGRGGNMFAMCSATSTLDIALAAEGVDICAEEFDGDAPDINAQSKLDFSKCLAFKDFRIEMNPYLYLHSNIDVTNTRQLPGVYDRNAGNSYGYSTASLSQNDVITLYSAPAKFDQVSAMLTQNHTNTIRGFMGQTTAFRKSTLKPGVAILADFPECNEARYIHGEYGSGSWTFLGGHDPEDYQHMIYNPPTDLSLHRNSPGYRLILNNVLFPAVKKTSVPTVTLNSGAALDTANNEKTTAPFAVNNVVAVRNLKLYPNPANNELTITLSPGTIETVEIENFAGQQVLSQSFAAAKVSVSMSKLPAGMYAIKVNGEFAGKVVKE
jgi:Secretion system C-terminal sorting domain